MYHQPTLLGLDSAISSPESAGGVTRCDSQAGQTMKPCGPDLVLANLSARQALERGLMTKDTYGHTSDGSLTNADLSPSLASRLRAVTDVNGSPEYVLTWTYWDMPQGPPIYALLASGRRTSGNGFFGWPTPDCPNGGRSVSHVDTWRGNTPYNKAGKKIQTDLQFAARLAGYPTPRAEDAESSGKRHSRGASDTLTAVTRDIAGYPTPTSPVNTDGHQAGNNRYVTKMMREAIGQMPSGSEASTEKRGALNPALSRWLQGYPAEWDSCGATAMQSSRKSQPNS